MRSFQCDCGGHPVGVFPPDPAADQPLQPPFQHGGEAAQLLLDGLGLADERLQDAILGPLAVEEVVTMDLGCTLQLAVDTPVALLHAAGVPGHVEVEEVGAVILEVHAFARGVGGDEDAQRMPSRVGVEGALDLLAAGLVHSSVKGGEPGL